MWYAYIQGMQTWDELNFFVVLQTSSDNVIDTK